MTKIVQKRLFKNYTLNDSKVINIYTHKIYYKNDNLYCNFVVNQKEYNRKINTRKSKYINKLMLYFNFNNDKFVLMAL
jgi:hypothetical protein